MFTMSWSTFRERWQLFVGSVLTVSVGVALVQASLLTLLAAVASATPPGLSATEKSRWTTALQPQSPSSA